MSDTREQILEEAMRCFADAGFHGTSLNDIAAGVGIRKPTLLHHFGTKENLYSEVFERLLSLWIVSVEDGADSPGGGWEKVDAMLEVGFRFFAENPDFIRLVRREAIDAGRNLGVDLAAAIRPLFDRAVAFFEQEMDAGRFRRHDARQLVLTGYGALLTYFSDAVFLAGLLDADPMSPELLSLRLDHLRAFFRAALVP